MEVIECLHLTRATKAYVRCAERQERWKQQQTDRLLALSHDTISAYRSDISGGQPAEQWIGQFHSLATNASLATHLSWTMHPSIHTQSCTISVSFYLVERSIPADQLRLVLYLTSSPQLDSVTHDSAWINLC